MASPILRLADPALPSVTHAASTPMSSASQLQVEWEMSPIGSCVKQLDPQLVILFGKVLETLVVSVGELKTTLGPQPPGVLAL